MAQGARSEPADFGIGTLFKIVRDAVIVANAQTERIVLWNEGAQRCFGYTEEAALELPLHRLVPESLRDKHRKGLGGYQSTGRGELVDSDSPIQLVGLRQDGSEVPIELTLTAIDRVDEDGSRFALAIVRDVSERKLAEERRTKLKEAHQSQEQALELNDQVVQGLAVAKMALEMGLTEKAAEAIQSSLANAQAIVGQLLATSESEIKPGDLITHKPHSDPSEDQSKEG